MGRRGERRRRREGDELCGRRMVWVWGLGLGSEW